MARDSRRTTRGGDLVTDSIDEQVLLNSDPRDCDCAPAATAQRVQRNTHGRGNKGSREMAVPDPEAS